MVLAQGWNMLVTLEEHACDVKEEHGCSTRDEHGCTIMVWNYIRYILFSYL